MIKNKNKTIDFNIINKINNPDLLPNTYVIFFDYSCPFSLNAIKLLRSSRSNYKGYNINNIQGNMRSLLRVLNNTSQYTGFDSSHRTKPIIFLDGKFIGGYNQLERKISYSD